MFFKYMNLLLIAALLIIPYAQCRPYRQKRVSDQRLAELETLLALSQMRGKLVSVPIGFGRIDPGRLGRRRRSVEMLLQELLENQDEERAREEEDTQQQWLPEMI